MKMIALLIAMFFSGSLMAQNDSILINTSWKGTINVPNPTDVIFTFVKDTITISVEGQAFEVMNYERRKDSLFVHKIYGASPCDNQALMVWKVSIKEDELTIRPLSDECPGRSSNLGEDTYFARIKTKNE